MRYYSTRGSSPPAELDEVLLHGLAPDGGLYLPERIPALGQQEWTRLTALAAGGRALDDPAAARHLLHATAELVLSRWFGEEIPPGRLKRIAVEAQSFPIPIRRTAPYALLELFHGPTMAFKDVAAHNLARLMADLLERKGRRATLLVATSGDTGGAIAHGFADLEALDVIVLFPRGRVSRLQEEQLTRVARNVTPVEVDGDFDACQALVKRALAAPALAALNPTSANSINIGRLIPQIVYYVYAAAALEEPALTFVVPSGNFGNLTAGLLARAMGLEGLQFVAATNANDVVPRFLAGGDWRPRPTVPTLSTAMDVGEPSNFSRIAALFDRQPAAIRQGLRGVAVGDAETVATIRAVAERTGRLLCPHTAVAWAAAERLALSPERTLLLATASPLKFAAEIQAATGLEVDDGAALAQLRVREARRLRIPADWTAFESLLMRHLAQQRGRE